MIQYYRPVSLLSHVNTDRTQASTTKFTLTKKLTKIDDEEFYVVIEGMKVMAKLASK